MLAAVRGAEDAALLLRTGCATKRAGKDDVRIRGMDNDAADTSGVRQPHVRPGLTGVDRFVDTIAHHVAVANDPGFTGACPNHAWIRGRDRERADGRGRLLVKDRVPAIAPITRLPNTAGCR